MEPGPIVKPDTSKATNDANECPDEKKLFHTLASPPILKVEETYQCTV